jgi:hypothetical protein
MEARISQLVFGLERGRRLLGESRRRAAVCLVEAYACQYIWFHEIAHVVLGHLDYTAKERQTESFVEVRSGKELADGTMILFEIEADTLAFSMVFEQPFDRHQLIEKIPKSNIYPDLSYFGFTSIDAAMFAFLGCLLSTLIFHVGATLMVSATQRVTHPPPWFRAELALGIALTASNDQGFDSDLATDRLVELMRSIRKADPMFREWVDLIVNENRSEEKRELTREHDIAVHVAKLFGNFPITYEPRVCLDQERPIVAL